MQAIPLSERAARQVLDAITRHTTTTEMAEVMLRTARALVQTTQKRLDETVEAVLAAQDMDVPKDYHVMLDGLMLHVMTPDDIQGSRSMPGAPIEHSHNGSA